MLATHVTPKITSPQTTARLISLECARGFAALLVVANHIDTIWGSRLAASLGSGTWLQILRLLSSWNVMAVMFFFVLSGFCIRLSTTNFNSELVLEEYLYRRARRILPLYWFALAFSFAAALIRGYWQSHSTSLSVLAGNLMLLQTSASDRGCWFPPFALNGPLWSLSYEVFYYILYAIWEIVLQRFAPGIKRMISFPLALAASISTIALNTVWPSPFTSFVTLYAVWYAGVLIADLWRETASPKVCIPQIALGCLACFGLRHFVHHSNTLNVLSNALVLALVTAILISSGLIGRFENLRGIAHILVPGRKLGESSYALYLLHMPVLLALVHLSAPSRLDPLIVISAITATLLASALLEQRVGRMRISWIRPRYISRLMWNLVSPRTTELRIEEAEQPRPVI